MLFPRFYADAGKSLGPFLPGSAPTVQGSDTTMLRNHSKAGTKKIKNLTGAISFSAPIFL